MNPVTLTTSGSCCTISNGILTLSWKEDGTIGSIVLDGEELVCNTPERSDTNGKTVFYVDYHADGAFRKYRSPRLKVIESSEKMAHIAYVDATGYLAIEYHIILMQGESGYYSYVIGANNTDTEFELSEFRIVYRCGSRVFDHAYNNERHGLQPTHKYMEEHEKLFDETFRLPDGEKYTNGDVYSKYDYAGYFSENPAWGQYGHGYGFWLIPVSTEYYPGGPLKQELLVHYDGIVLNYFTGAHFGTGALHVPIGWKKFYGPFYQYFNKGDDPDALYQDALARAAEEQKKWPYQWVCDPLYPLVRSEVKGRLTFEDGSPCTDTTVILGKGGFDSGLNNSLVIEKQSSDYIYYTTTDAEGNFTLKNVRFGTYALFAYQTGGSITEQLQVNGLVISSPSQTLAPITWKLPARKVLWQLGRATRTCEEYRYGGELRNHKWMGMVPETLHFTIGTDKEADDWYYAQTKPGTWYLHFHLEALPASSCKLIIAIAGARGGLLKVFLNGETEENMINETYLVGDSAIYRSATKNGRYRRIEIPIAPELLKKGENIISLANQDCMIMYDTILLTEECEQ